MCTAFLSCRISVISAFCWQITQTHFHSQQSLSFTQSQLTAILVLKLVAMATSLSTSGLPPNTRLLGPIRAHNPNGISMGSAVFAEMTAECPYTLQSDAPSPQNCPFPWGIWTPSNTRFPRLTRVLNGISIGSAVFAWAHQCDTLADRQIDRQTDRQTTLLGR